jgi:hypothetical protein
MYFGEVIVLAIVLVCLYGFYDTLVEALRRHQNEIRFNIEDDNRDR